jgi:DNA-binding response OmpR family regulator
VGDKKILLVDDEDQILQMLKEAFSLYGYKVRQHQARRGPDVLARKAYGHVLDLKLPA